MSLFVSKETLKQLRETYSKGSRVELLRMDDPQAPPVGTLGTVVGVDDTGSILVRWDNGCGLNVVYGQDKCRVITPNEPAGSTLTLILEDGEWKQVGPIPKIDPTKIPQYALDSLCRTLLECVRHYFEDPEHEKAFQEWKRQKDAEKSAPDNEL